MKSRRRFEWILAALLFIALSAGAVLAQDQESAPPPASPSAQQGDSGQGAPQQDPPGRVARVQYMSGQVSMQPGGVNDWVAASTNRPLTTADRVWTDKNSRAELNVGDGFIRMNSETSLTLTNVSDRTVQLELDQGILSLTVRHLERGEVYEVDTPNYAFTVMKSGLYRFDVYPSEDQSWITVRSGYGEATGQGSAVRVNSGTQVRFRNGNTLIHTAEDAPARDGFDDWARVRDQRLDDSVSARYVSPGVIGYQDLDAYGRWIPTPEYGTVWIPSSVPAGWAPYRFGHWVWIAPWGWTWVDDAPWGFAPFHYGRWVSWGGGWGWAPGPVGYWNPYYAPALVGWVGGPGFGIGFGFGGGGWGLGINFGWFPLGWGEPYYPRYCGWGRGGWYRGGGWVSNSYFRNVNITNTHITNINNITNSYHGNNFANAHYGFRNVAGAVTAAPRTAFASGAAINRVGGAVPKAYLGRGQLVRTADVNPTRESVLGGRSPLTRGVPPASAMGRSVVTRTPPPAVRPAGVGASQSTLARSNGAVTGNRNMGANATHAPQPATSANIGAPRNNAPRSTAGADNQLARANIPTSLGGHYVPRPPSAGGMATARPNTPVNSGQASAPARNAPRAAAGNDSFARPNGSTGGARGSANVADNRGPAINNPRSGHGTNASSVPRPPQSYQPSRPASAAPQYSAPSRQSTPANRPVPQSTPRNGNSSNGPGARSSAPRPPANYSYRSAPVQQASSAYRGAPAASTGYRGGYNRSYSPAESYSAARGGYQSMPAYSAPRSSAPSPAYSPRSYGSTSTYASRSMGSYSAPRSSGGGYRAPSGGSYRGGGGGSHSSGNGGGGHHGR